MSGVYNLHLHASRVCKPSTTKCAFKGYEQAGGVPLLGLFHCGMPQADPKLKFVLSVLFRGSCAWQEKTSLLLLIKSVFSIEKSNF